MKKIFLLNFLLFSLFAFAQSDQLAQNYFDKGDFEKAKISYEELLKSQPSNWNYTLKLIDCYQQLEQYLQAEVIIKERFEKYKQANFLVELGYNYQLQNDAAKSKKYYDEALGRIKKNPTEVYAIASAFEKKSLVEYALKAYEMAIEIEPNFNFNYQMALLYGQMGKMDMMIDKLLLEAQANPMNSVLIQNQLSRFMNESEDNGFNETLRKSLLVKAQKTQDVFWNEYLSWFYVQQKEYGKAFIQEKAIYKRESASLSNIFNLSQLAIQENENETAIEILTYVLENTKDIDLLIQANAYLLEMRIEVAKTNDYKAIEEDLALLLKQYEISPYSLSLQLLQAHFLTFNLKNPEAGKAVLKTALELPLNKYQIANVKMELADILLFEEKFNQALVYYSQIEEDLKNDVIGHEATLKSAKTSYFKADFKWALKQFKELKSASSQLIANDALEYFLLINDNIIADSTQVALKQFARADYLSYQSKNQEALTAYQNIIKTFPGNEIEPVTHLRMGQLYEQLGEYNLALSQYETIIRQFKDGIYIDEAYYFSANIYNLQVKDDAKAKANYEQIIFHHEDSIYFTDARKKYRQLRGDTAL